MSLHSSVILSGIHRVIILVAVHLAEGVVALLLTSVSEEDGWERGVVGLVDDPEPDVVTPINKVVVLVDKISFSGINRPKTKYLALPILLLSLCL